MGIDESDFNEGPLIDFGKALTIETSTGTVDTFGNEFQSFSTGTITAVFHERTKNIVRGPDGTIIESPAYLMSNVSDSVGTGDKVTVDGRKWSVFNVINRKGIFKYSDLYLEEK